MQKLFFILFLFATVQFTVKAQSKVLSEEGYKHWIKAITLIEDIKNESEYFFVLTEFGKVLETDPTYADVYYNMGKIYSTMGELGGGIYCFNKSKEFYEKYLEFNPSEKHTIIKELARLEAKMDSFMRNVLNDMSLIKGADIKEKKKVFKVNDFYIKRNLFSIVDYKSLITPMSIAVASYLMEKTFNVPYILSPTGDDNFPYLLNPNTNNMSAAEQIIEIINCISGKNFFIPTQDHNQMMQKNKTLYSECSNSTYIELFNTGNTKNKQKLNGALFGAAIAISTSNPTAPAGGFSFRLALPASEK